jgi:hypothetical protein
MKHNTNTLQLNKNLNIESPHKHLLVSLTLLSKDLKKSDPVFSGISFPMHVEFWELFEILLSDPNFRAKFSLFSLPKTRIIHVIENYKEGLETELNHRTINSNFDDQSSPVIIEAIEITYKDLINNKQIIEILNPENASEFNQTLFFFEDCTWIKIKDMLASNNITLTVGSNTRRQFLSPIEYKFSLFLMCLGISLEEISKTFLRYEQYDKHQQKLAIKKQKIEKNIERQSLKRINSKRFNKKSNKFSPFNNMPQRDKTRK